MDSRAVGSAAFTTAPSHNCRQINVGRMSPAARGLVTVALPTAVPMPALAAAKQEHIEEDRAQRQAARRAKLTEEQRQAEDARIKRQRRTREQREKQEAEAQAQREAREAREARRASAVQEIAQILTARLGPDMDRFLVLAEDTWLGDILKVLNAGRRGLSGNGAYSASEVVE
jgi:hypothetical protein